MYKPSQISMLIYLTVAVIGWTVVGVVGWDAGAKAVAAAKAKYRTLQRT